ncbi:MAG: signal peptidase II [Actinomycetaceae bacterium]|nr:signal peptidase II [Actinomycetaceae bacterium]
MSHSFPAMKTRIAYGAGLAAFGAITDQLSKEWALVALADGQKRPVIGNLLSLDLIHNSGAAFSLGSSMTWIFTVLSVVILGALAYWIWRGCSLWMTIAIGLLGGGAIGNLIDRLIREPGFGVGHVVDFINYNDLFIGNVADIWIVGAAAWIAILVARTPSAASESTAAEKDADA